MTNRLRYRGFWRDFSHFVNKYLVGGFPPNVLFSISLENQKTRLENQKSYSVVCTGKFVFGFQDNLCSLGLLENQIELFGIMRFGTQIGTLEIFD